MDHVQRHAADLEGQLKHRELQYYSLEQRYKALEKFIRENGADQLVTREFFQQAIAGLATHAGVHAELKGAFDALCTGFRENNKAIESVLAEQSRAIKGMRSAGDSSEVLGQLAAMQTTINRLSEVVDHQKRWIKVLDDRSKVPEAKRWAKPVCHIVVTISRRDTVCGPPPTLVAELGRAKRRVELEAKIDTASAELAKNQPARVANSDAKALQRYLLAVGVDIAPERLNDLLVLLSVLMIEVGGSLALAIGIALGDAPAGRTAAPVSTQPEQPQTPALNALNSPGAAIETLPAPVFKPSVQLRSDRAPAVQAADIVGLVREAGGALRTTTRRLGVQLGRPAASVHGELRRLATAGLISLNADSRGTLITVGSAARPN
jgi:hypothetical protein